MPVFGEASAASPLFAAGAFAEAVSFAGAEGVFSEETCPALSAELSEEAEEAALPELPAEYPPTAMQAFPTFAYTDGISVAGSSFSAVSLINTKGSE